MEALTFQWLFAIGILLIGLEALMFSFFLFPVGFGFIIVSVIHLYFVQFHSLFSQIAAALIIGLFVILLFRKKFIYLLGKSSSTKEEKIHVSGTGIVDGKQIKFEGTFWNTNDDLSLYKDGDKVEIEIFRNKAVLKK